MGGQGASNGVTISSYVYVIVGSSLTLQESGGYVMSSSSVNASAFFGNGSNLGGIGSLTAAQTFSGSNIFASSFTVQSNGGQISLSTSTTINNIQISAAGIVSFSPEMYNSSSTIIPAASTTNSTCDAPCVAGSSLTITTSGGRVEAVLIAGLDNAASTNRDAVNILQDGQYVRDLSNVGVIRLLHINQFYQINTAFHYIFDAPPAGVHTYCITLCTNLLTSAYTANLLNDPSTGLNGNLFFVKEIK